MQIKNILTNEIDIVKEFIIKELCKKNIPYIFIKESNELHFDKYIFRFYDKKTVSIALKKYITIPTIKTENDIHFNNSNKKQKLRPNYKNTNNILKKHLKYNNKKHRK